MIRKKDFTLTFESQGTDYIFEDLVGTYYMPGGESVRIYHNGRMRVFISQKTIAEMNKLGEATSVSGLRENMAFLRKTLKQIQMEMKNYKHKLKFTADDARYMFKLMGSVCEAYLVYDFNYWDTTWEKAKHDSAAQEKVKLVESFKNEVRSDINKVFFGTESYLSILLTEISRTFDIPFTDLVWYQEQEILELFVNKVVEFSALEQRKKGSVFYKNSFEDSINYIGKKAQEIMKEFSEIPDTSMRTITGTTAHNPGTKIKGKITIITRAYGDQTLMRQKMADMNQGDILVSETTDPELMEACRKASAIITDVGGMLSHAAITARELGIPCVVGTKIATQALKDGDMVEVDAQKGIVKVI